jgi:protein-S-isoprenylcysteine O-methyltransferase Ste14
MSSLYTRAAGRLLQLPMMMGVLLFLPAWTLDYWQGWVFAAVFFVCSLATTVYLAVTDPKLLERRMKAGPWAEKEKAQKIIMVLAMLSFAATVAFPAIDHRYGWSHVPVRIVILGDVLIVLGFLTVFFVLRENPYSASTIQIAEDQRVISTGPYAIVRHPMYSGSFVLVAGIPLALGSWWGLLTFVPTVAGITWRLLEEEKFLSKNLPGYGEYAQKVRYRLVPHLW